MATTPTFVSPPMEAAPGEMTPTPDPPPMDGPGETMPRPASAPTGASRELLIKAKDWFCVEGVQYRPGDIVRLRESLALSLVGAGAADQVTVQ